jgi:hypothetical protein
MTHSNEPAAPDARRRRFRNLRIAWSVVCSIATVLLVVLWVRSYWWEDGLVWVRGSARNVILVNSKSGTLGFSFCPGGDAEEQLLPPFFKLTRPLPRNSQVTPFAWFSDAVLTIIRVPTWALIALSVAIGTTPWFGHPRRFSLRTLLIATTVVAVGLGLIVYLAR